MSGLMKHKQYDWKDSNLALFGSDTDKQVKKESAEQEKAWHTAGRKPGLQIWRIVKFKVTNWPAEDYGKFYEGDSYIILNTYRKEDSEALLYDVHFWIGKYSTQDEYGTAAYKTVELDTYLNDVPIQHREVQEHESKLFRSYFKAITHLRGGAESGFSKVKPEQYIPRLFHFHGNRHSVTVKEVLYVTACYLKGGAESGFNRVTPVKYTPRLLHFHGDRRKVTVKEIPRNFKNLDNTDVYILDVGLTIYQWNGRGSNKDERVRALQYVNELRAERSGKAVRAETIDQDAGSSGAFMRYFIDTEKDKEEDNDTSDIVEDADTTKELYRLSDADGSLKFSLERKGDVSMKDFDSDDVFILDTKKELFVWIGHGTTMCERKNAMTYAHNYLMKSPHPFIPISCLKQGDRSTTFYSALAA